MIGRTIRLLLLLKLMLALFTVSALAQNNAAVVSGVITGENGEPVPGITAMLENTSKGTATDFEGRFELKGVAPGTYQLLISGIGYQKQSLLINTEPGQKVNINITLDEDTQQLQEVVVRAESEAVLLERTAQAVNAIDTREVKLKSADLGEVMARVEGVSIQRTGGLGSGARISLNGLTGDQVRFFLDGIPLDYTPYSFGMANIPVNNIERVEIYKGVVPIQFGADALGGAVNLVTSDVPEHLSGAASYQVGSFGTKRFTSNVKFFDPKSSFFVDAGGFYDFSENDYKVNVEVADERGKLKEVNVPRFHDGYQAYGVNLSAGIRNRNWARELSVRGFYANYEKDIQHNQIMAGIPYGDVQSFNNNRGINLIYRNEFAEKINVELLSGFNHSERIFLDTSRFVYNWYGEKIRESDGDVLLTRPGEIGDASHQFTWDNNYFARLNISYRISNKHRIKFTVAPNYSLRTGDELLIGTFDPLAAEGRVYNLVNGLEYTFDSFNKKLQNILFGKRYEQGLEAKKSVPGDVGFVVTERSNRHYGYGNGLRYSFNRNFMAKLTYEYAIRMPRQDEILGDGQFVVKNLELNPERSHNANLELEFNQINNSSPWQIKSNFFMRRITDLILLLPATDRSSIYQNVFEANSIGLEMAGKWSGFKEKLNVDFNATYQHFYNSSKEGAFEAFYGDRIPNMPFLFANSQASYAWRNTFAESDKLSFFWSARYVHEFYRSWESAGIKAFKVVIPSQLVNNLGITYELMLQSFRHTFTAEVQNISDAMVFDFLGVQRPGRAFYIKLTTHF